MPLTEARFTGKNANRGESRVNERRGQRAQLLRVYGSDPPVHG